MKAVISIVVEVADEAAAHRLGAALLGQFIEPAEGRVSLLPEGSEFLGICYGEPAAGEDAGTAVEVAPEPAPEPETGPSAVEIAEEIIRQNRKKKRGDRGA
jgi:hypothetical protein